MRDTGKYVKQQMIESESLAGVGVKSINNFYSSKYIHY